MSFKKIGLVAVTIIFAAAALSACSSSKSYGTIPQNAPVTEVKNIIMNPQTGADVVVAGKIKTQCGSNGCWLFLDDGTGQVLVLLNALNLGLPQSVGKSARVAGAVAVDKGQVMVIAKGLEVN